MKLNPNNLKNLYRYYLEILVARRVLDFLGFLGVLGIPGLVLPDFREVQLVLEVRQVQVDPVDQRSLMVYQEGLDLL